MRNPITVILILVFLLSGGGVVHAIPNQSPGSQSLLTKIGVTAILAGTFAILGWAARTRVTKREKLLHAIEQGNVAAVTALLEKGASPNAKKGKERDRALHLAVRGGHKEIASILIQNGANVSNCNRHNETALHLCGASGLSPIATLLVQSGAEVNAEDYWGKTPLDNAVEANDVATQEILTANGGYRNIKMKA